MNQVTFIEPGKLEVWDVPEPELVAPGDAIVSPLVVGRCDLDAAFLNGVLPLPGPFPLGHETIAEVIALADDAADLQIGDRVVVAAQISCGCCVMCRHGRTASCQRVPYRSAFGMGRDGEWGGALSDRLRVPFAEHMLTRLPDGVDPVLAVSVADTALDAWRCVGPYLTEWPGGEVLVVGGLAATIGLQVVAIARALGASRVLYVDHDTDRLEVAQAMGAEVLAGEPPRTAGTFRVTVDASGVEAGLQCAIRSTGPGGHCTSPAIYLQELTGMPLFEMYYNDIHFHTGRPNVRMSVPHVLALLRGGGYRPDLVTTRVSGWEHAAEAFLDPTVKPVLQREQAPVQSKSGGSQ